MAINKQHIKKIVTTEPTIKAERISESRNENTYVRKMLFGPGI
jgi:hypothetical protein